MGSVCPPPLLISAQQSPLAAILLHQDLNVYEWFPGWFRISLEVSLGSLRTAFSSRFPGSVEPCYAFFWP
jgi:hypothetical protein